MAGLLQLHAAAASAQQETASCALPFLFRSSSFPFFYLLSCFCCLFLLKIVSPLDFLPISCGPPSPSISHDSSGEATRDATSWLRPCKKETRQPREKQTQHKNNNKNKTTQRVRTISFYYYYYFVWLENASVHNWRDFSRIIYNQIIIVWNNNQSIPSAIYWVIIGWFLAACNNILDQVFVLFPPRH